MAETWKLEVEMEASAFVYADDLMDVVSDMLSVLSNSRVQVRYVARFRETTDEAEVWSGKAGE